MNKYKKNKEVLHNPCEEQAFTNKPEIKKC